ncbi:penicillin-binding protein [bacterium]|nr:penicillin-binding protein [bacterium]
MFEKGQRIRASLIFFFLFAFLLTLTIRLAYLQIVRSPELQGKAQNRWKPIKIEPQRGIIYDRRMRKLAISLSLNSLYARPKKIENKEEIAEKLSLILKKNPSPILEKLNREKNFVWLARKIPKDLAEEIKGLNIEGIGLTEESKRLYPKGSFACHLLGFAGLDDQGLEGIELLYNQYIKGTPGWILSTRDARGRSVLSGEYRFYPPSGGYDIILTIDESIQHIAERELEKVYKEQGARSATIIVMDPKTGEVLALANQPSYDLNRFEDYPSYIWRNQAVTDLFEPGSSLKIVTAAAALAEDVVKYEDRFYCENGVLRVSKDHVVHDINKYEWLTFSEVIEKSSNIGTIKIGQRLGPLKLYEYLRSFGFGSLTGVDLPGEVRGILRKPREWSDLSMAALPIGHEISVTAIQLATAASAIANGGVLVRPRVVKAVVSKEGRVVKEFEPTSIRRVISQETAYRLTDILKGVTLKGTGTRAQVPGYEVAGKTGTAQKIDPKTKKYSQDKTTATFLGWVPADDPRILILVVVDEPKGLPYEGRMVRYGGLIAAPVFKEVAQRTLRYLNVPPGKSPTGEIIRVSLSDMDLRVQEIEIESREKMPDLNEKSMRETFRILSNYDLKPNFIGSGQVMRQDPPPESPLEGIKECTVWFASR